MWIEYNTDEQVQIIAQLYNLIGEEDIFIKSGYTDLNAEQKLHALYSDIISNKVTFGLTLLKQIVVDIIEKRYCLFNYHI